MNNELKNPLMSVKDNVDALAAAAGEKNHATRLPELDARPLFTAHIIC